jgi:hypothetical protein
MFRGARDCVDARTERLAWTGLVSGSMLGLGAPRLRLPLGLLGAARTPQLRLLSVENADMGADDGAGAAVLALGPRLRTLRLRDVVLGERAEAVARGLGSHGSLTELDLSGTGFASGAAALARALRALGSLRVLRLARVPGGGVPSEVLCALSALGGLLELDLSGDGGALESGLAVSLGSLGALTALRLADARLGAPVVAALPRLRALRELDLRGAKLVGAGAGSGGVLDVALAALTALVRLDLAHLSSVEPSGRRAAVVGALSALTALRALAVDGLLDGGDDAVCAALAASLAAMPGLLSLSANLTGPEGIHGSLVGVGRALATLTRLRELRLSGLLFAEVGAPLPAALSTLRDLRVLAAGGLECPDPDGRLAAVAAALAASGAPLAELDIVGSWVSGAAASAPALARLPAGVLGGLQSLVLSGAFLGTEGAARLAPVLARMTGLRALDLDGNRLGAAGVAALAPALARLARLEALALSRNELGADAIAELMPALAPTTSLRALQLGDNAFSRAGAATLMHAIRNTMPALDVLNVSGVEYMMVCLIPRPPGLTITREAFPGFRYNELIDRRFDPETGNWQLVHKHSSRTQAV